MKNEYLLKKLTALRNVKDTQERHELEKIKRELSTLISELQAEIMDEGTTLKTNFKKRTAAAVRFLKKNKTIKPALFYSKKLMVISILLIHIYYLNLKKRCRWRIMTT